MTVELRLQREPRAPALQSQRPLNRWIAQIFRAKAAKEGGVVRRSLRSVLQNGGLQALREEVSRRGFRMEIKCDQCVIYCCDCRSTH